MNTATTITIAALAALTPTVTCLIGIILMRQDMRDVRSELSGVRSEFKGELVAFRSELRADLGVFRSEVRGDLGVFRSEMRSEMTALRNMVHADMLLVHERVARVEAKQTQQG